MNRQCPLFKLYAVGDNYYAKYFLEISCCCCVGWRRGGGSRGLTRDFAGVFGGSDSENFCGGWEEGRSVVPAAPALKPSAERYAPSARHLLAWLKPRPIKAAGVKSPQRAKTLAGDPERGPFRGLAVEAGVRGCAEVRSHISEARCGAHRVVLRVGCVCIRGFCAVRLASFGVSISYGN